MTKKVIFSIIIGILALISLGAWRLSTQVNTNALKVYIANRLFELSSEPVTINGDLKWQLFPEPALSVSDVLVGDTKEKNKFIFELKKLDFNLKLSALLGRKIVFNDINVKGFNLIIDQNQSFPAKAMTEKPMSIPVTPGSSVDFSINKLRVTQGKIILINSSNELALNHLTFEATDINLVDKIFHFKISTKMASMIKEKPLKANLEFQGRTHINAHFLQQLDTLWMHGQLSGHNIYYDKVLISKLSANFLLKKQLLSFNPLTLDLYNSSTVGELHYNLGSHQLSLKQSASSLDGEPLLQDLINHKIISSGKLDFSVNTTIDLKQPYTKSAVGYVNIKDGALEGLNLDELITILSEQLAVLFSDKSFDINKTASDLIINHAAVYQGNTPFKLITLPYKLNNSILKSDGVVVQTNNLKITGDSQLNLLNNDIDGHLQATITTTNSTINQVQANLGGSFPLTLDGTLVKPIVLPDLYKINPIITRIMITDTLSKPINKVKEHFKNLLNVL